MEHMVHTRLNHKKIIAFSFTLLIIFVFWFYQKNNKISDNEKPQKNIEVIYTNGENLNNIKDEYKKSAILKALTYFDKNQEYFKTFNLPNGMKLYSTSYDGIKHDNILDGLIIVNQIGDKKYQILFEALNNFGSLMGENVFKDLTGDGLPEIITNWAGACAGENYIWFYTMKDDTFIPLNFTENKIEPRNRLVTFGYEEFKDQIKDIDNDGVFELILKKREFLNNNKKKEEQNYLAKDYTDIDCRFNESDLKYLTKTYKWNGTEYFLWKEQKEPFE